MQAGHQWASDEQDGYRRSRLRYSLGAVEVVGDLGLAGATPTTDKS